MKLILFDIDGTLIRSHGAGRETITATLEELFGTAGPIDEYKMSGKIDYRIITDLLTAVGIQKHEIEAKLPVIYSLMTEKAQAIFPNSDMKSCSGVEGLLDALNQRDDVLLGLLTGNINSTAPLKLMAAGINPDQFKLGVYGSDAQERNQLPAIAIKRASYMTGRPFTGKNTVIIGDTPADILCARAGKATAVAVASGWHSVQTLARYQPDHLLENLSDTVGVLDILLR